VGDLEGSSPTPSARIGLAVLSRREAATSAVFRMSVSEWSEPLSKFKELTRPAIAVASVIYLHVANDLHVANYLHCGFFIVQWK
jgi:hypothetical protein